MFGIKATSDMALWEAQINYRAQCRCGVGVGAYVRKKERKKEGATVYSVILFIGAERQWGDIMLVGGLLVLLVLCY